MDRGFRRGFTAAEKTELWDRWQRGESLKAIGRAFGKPSSSIYFQVSPHGGIRPASRRRSRLALTLSEREEISRGIAVHRSARSMAGLLGRSPSCHFFKAAYALDAVRCGGTTSIYARSLSDLPRLASKAFIAKVRLEWISAKFLLSRYFRLFQQNRPKGDFDPRIAIHGRSCGSFPS